MLKPILIDGDLLSIEEASLQLKIPKHTLRYWEKEFLSLFSPERTPGGQRRYTQKDLIIIEEIKKLREEGLSLAQIRKKFHNGNDQGYSNSAKIDLLAQKVAEVVKTEVYQFFEKESIFNNEQK